MKRHDEFEPMKLIAVTERLRAWASVSEQASLDQVQEDIKFILDSHLDYYKRYEKWGKAYWYQIESEGNGNVSISWRERAEEMEKAAKTVLRIAETWAKEIEDADGPFHRWPDKEELDAAKEILES